MIARVERTKCQHMQEYGDTYAVLVLEDGCGVKHYLRVPMWQYQESYTPKLLENAAHAINSHFNWLKSDPKFGG